MKQFEIIVKATAGGGELGTARIELEDDLLELMGQRAKDPERLAFHIARIADAIAREVGQTITVEHRRECTPPAPAQAQPGNTVCPSCGWGNLPIRRKCRRCGLKLPKGGSNES